MTVLLKGDVVHLVMPGEPGSLTETAAKQIVDWYGSYGIHVNLVSYSLVATTITIVSVIRNYQDNFEPRPVEPRKLDQILSVRLEPEIAAALRDLANSQGVTVSDLLRSGAAKILDNSLGS